MAGLLLSLHPGVTVYADAEQGASPRQIPFAQDLASLATGSSDELGVEELLRLADDG